MAARLITIKVRSHLSETNVVHGQSFANNIVIIFYVTSATVLFWSVSLTEISQVEKLYMSVGTNMLINGKLDKGKVVAVLLWQSCS